MGFAINVWNQIDNSTAFNVGALENVSAAAIIKFCKCLLEMDGHSRIGMLIFSFFFFHINRLFPIVACIWESI